jgi:hypothetical protein
LFVELKFFVEYLKGSFEIVKLRQGFYDGNKLANLLKFCVQINPLVNHIFTKQILFSVDPHK